MNTRLFRRLVSLYLLCLFGVFANAQTTTVDTRSGQETTGTVKDYSAGNTLVIDTLPPNPSMQFKLSKNVTFADTDGKTIEAAGLTTNRRVRVHFVRVGADNVADKITLVAE